MRRFAFWILLASGLSPVVLLAADEKPASTGRMVSIEVVVAQFAEGTKHLDLNLESPEKLAARIQELDKQGQLSHLTRMRVSTLDQQQAQLQLGQRAPVASGRTRVGGFARGGGGNPAGGGPIATSYTIENVGTLLGVTPQIEGDGSVSLKLDLEKSQIEPPAAGEPGPEVVDLPPSRTDTLHSHSVVRVRSGQTAVVGQAQSSSKGVSTQSIILVTVQVSDAPVAVKTTEAAAEQVLKVFALQNLPADASIELLAKLFKDASVQIAAESRTNSVLVRAPEATMSEIEAILLRLDQQRK